MYYILSILKKNTPPQKKPNKKQKQNPPKNNKKQTNKKQTKKLGKQKNNSTLITWKVDKILPLPKHNVQVKRKKTNKHTN